MLVCSSTPSSLCSTTPCCLSPPRTSASSSAAGQSNGSDFLCSFVAFVSHCFLLLSCVGGVYLSLSFYQSVCVPFFVKLNCFSCAQCFFSLYFFLFFVSFFFVLLFLSFFPFMFLMLGVFKLSCSTPFAPFLHLVSVYRPFHLYFIPKTLHTIQLGDKPKFVVSPDITLCG